MENIEVLKQEQGGLYPKEIGVELRPLRAEDAGEVLRIASRERVARYMRFETLHTREVAEKVVYFFWRGGDEKKLPPENRFPFCGSFVRRGTGQKKKKNPKSRGGCGPV